MIKTALLLILFGLSSVYGATSLWNLRVGHSFNSKGSSEGNLSQVSLERKLNRQHKLSASYYYQERVINNNTLKDNINNLNYYYSFKDGYIDFQYGFNDSSIFLPREKIGVRPFYNLTDRLEVSFGYYMNSYKKNEVQLLIPGIVYKYSDICYIGGFIYNSKSTGDSLTSSSLMHRCSYEEYSHRIDISSGRTFADIGIEDQFSSISVLFSRKWDVYSWGVRLSSYNSEFIEETLVGLELSYSF